jgi:flagellar biosynthesis protein FlhA
MTTSATTTANASVSAKYNHLLVPTAIVGILAILIFPLPTAVLDVCIALNIVLSLIILFTSLYVYNVRWNYGCNIPRFKRR